MGSGMWNNLFGMAMMEDPEDPLDQMKDYVGDYFPYFGSMMGRQSTGATGSSTSTSSLPSFAGFNPWSMMWMNELNKPQATAPITPVRLQRPFVGTAGTTSPTATSPFGSLFGGNFNMNSLFGMAMMEDPEDPLDQMQDYLGDYYPYMASFMNRGQQRAGASAGGASTGTSSFGGLPSWAWFDMLSKPRPTRLSKTHTVTQTPPAATPTAASPFGQMNMNRWFQMAMMANPEDPMDEMKDMLGDYGPMMMAQAQQAGHAASTTPGAFNPMSYMYYDILNKANPLAKAEPVLSKAKPTTYIQPVVYPNGEVLYYPVNPVTKRLRNL